MACIKSGFGLKITYARAAFAAGNQREQKTMQNPLDSLWGTIISGVILTVILYLIVKQVLGG